MSVFDQSVPDEASNITPQHTSAAAADDSSAFKRPHLDNESVASDVEPSSEQEYESYVVTVSYLCFLKKIQLAVL